MLIVVERTLSFGCGITVVLQLLYIFTRSLRSFPYPSIALEPPFH